MTFADQIRYNKIFQKVLQKVEKSTINYIKIFQNTKALEISARNSYTEDMMMHTFLDYLQKGGKYSAHIASHQEEFQKRRKIHLYLAYKLIILIWTIQ